MIVTLCLKKEDINTNKVGFNIAVIVNENFMISVTPDAAVELMNDLNNLSGGKVDLSGLVAGDFNPSETKTDG